MYHFLLGITTLKSISPYFRKNLLDTLDSHEYAFLTSLIFFLLLLAYIIILNLTNSNVSFSKTLENYQKLTLSQIICIFMICIIAICSTLFLFELDKNYNTPLINDIYIKVASVVLMIFIGIVYFKEKYNITQILGFLFVIFGAYLVMNKDE